MNGMLSGIREYMAKFRGGNYQGQPVFLLTPQQYDLLAQDLWEVGDCKDFKARPALMIDGAKVELK